MGWGLAISGVASAAGSLYSSSMQASASGDAMEARLQAARNRLALQREMFKKRKELQRPYREAGYSALPELREYATGTPSAKEAMGPEQEQTYNKLQEMAEEPLYGVREGINQELAARGMSESTPGMQNLARGMSQERYNRTGNLYNLQQGARQNQFNRLAQLTNVGQQATARSSQAAGQFAQAGGNIYGQMGQARAQNALRQGNIQARAASQIGSMPMRGMQTYMMGKSSGVW